LLPLRSILSMNKTVEIVNLWAEFEAKHPKAGIEDFFRYQLINKRESNHAGKLVGGIIPPNTPGLLLKIIGRISRLHMMYSNLALEGTGVNQIEEFGILLTIESHKNPRKTEVIYDSLMELSSGTDMVNRLIKRGFVTEHNDKEDKRAKRLQLTQAGSKAIIKCKEKVVRMVTMMTADMADDDQKICVQLLKGMEIKFSERWLSDKSKPIEEVYREIAASKSDGEISAEDSVKAARRRK
jgi:DNA-binding MarR family transcriptional regulator